MSFSQLLLLVSPSLFQISLQEMGYDAERVINAVLEDRLPPSLQALDKTIAR